MKGIFAKTLEIDEHQVVVMSAQDSDCNPGIRMSFLSAVGLVETTIGFPDTDEGYGKRDTAFKRILDGDHAVVEAYVKSSFQKFGYPDPSDPDLVAG